MTSFNNVENSEGFDYRSSDEDDVISILSTMCSNANAEDAAYLVSEMCRSAYTRPNNFTMPQNNAYISQSFDSFNDSDVDLHFEKTFSMLNQKKNNVPVKQETTSYASPATPPYTPNVSPACRPITKSPTKHDNADS
eukprot:Awhi_evm1s9970